MISKVDGNLQGYGPAVLLAFSPGPGIRGFLDLKDHPELDEQPGPYRFTAGVHPGASIIQSSR